MKILHICLANFYLDGYAYQENLITKYHKKAGNDVNILASTMGFDKNWNFNISEKPGCYTNCDGIKYKRISYRQPNKIFFRLRKYDFNINTYLNEIKPDIIFIHGCQFLDITKIVKYAKRHKSVKIYVDNHADLKNSAKNWVSKNLLHKVIWRHCAKLIEPYTLKFYGVLPTRVDFLVDMYKLPKEKCELLVMGADDELLESSKNIDFRINYGFDNNDIIIVSAGKLDPNKPETINLMRAVNNLNSNIKMIFYGSIADEYKENFNELLSNKVKYGGWLKTENTYSIFKSADLLVFPGLHSVYWEQAVACGTPCIFRDLEGTHHIDIGGNCKFVKNGSVDELMNCLKEINDNREILVQMKEAAMSPAREKFLYSNIAKQSIEEE